MAEQRLIDANKILYHQAWESGSMEPANEGVALMSEVQAMPTIDPETLPLVRQLREELSNCKQELRQIKYCYDMAKNGEKQFRKQNDEIVALWAECAKKLKQVTAERDAAVSDLRGRAIESYSECMYCLYRTAKSFCWNCNDGSNWTWRGLHKEE